MDALSLCLPMTADTTHVSFFCMFLFYFVLSFPTFMVYVMSLLSLFFVIKIKYLKKKNTSFLDISEGTSTKTSGMVLL